MLRVCASRLLTARLFSRSVTCFDKADHSKHGTVAHGKHGEVDHHDSVSEEPLHVYDPAMVDPHKGKVASPDVTMPDELGHSVGKERYELLCKLHGIKDPYFESVVERAGTWEDPHLIPAFDYRRTVLCKCANTDGMHWYKHLVFRDIPSRCECGWWFKIVTPELPPFVDQAMKEQLLGHAAGHGGHH